MKLTILDFALLASAVSCFGDSRVTENVWKSGLSYTYEVEGRTLSALDHEASSWTGVNLKAQLTFQAKTADQLIAKFSCIRYAQVRQDLQNWDSVLQHNLKYKSYPALERPIELTMEGGIMRSITVDRFITVPEENLVKGLIGQFQYDTNSKKLIHSRRNYYDGQTARRVYRKMETDVTGKGEVVYSASPIGDNQFNFKLPSGYSKDVFTQILKTKNYANCEKRVAYHFGLPGRTSLDVGGQNNFLDESTVYRIIAHGNDNTIFSTEAITKVIATPLLYNQRAIVVSRVNATLIAIDRDDQAKALKGFINGRNAGSLLYSVSEKEASNDGSKRRQRRTVLQKISNSNVDITNADQSSIYDQYIRNDKNENVVEQAWKIVQTIVQGQNNFKQVILEKYNILVKIITSMSFLQLQTLNQFVNQQEEWRVIRDTVSQCGSIPSFQLVRYWIEKRQMKEEEAAEVVSVLALSLRYRTRHVMSDFFEMAMSDSVREEKYLNSSALLASTRFINMGHSESESFIKENVLPALQIELYDALTKHDSERAQVYIKAIGNLEHPNILEVFSPCLQGKFGTSTYLRTEIINSLGILCDHHPHLARVALFKVYQNSGERYEVRVAAVQQLMRCKPTRTMLQRMAEFTNIDDSNQVRAVVQSAIIYASKLRSEKFKDIAAAAKAAIPSLTTQEFGFTSSFKFLEDFESYQSNLGYLYGLHLMGSDDSILPKGFTQWWLKKQGGWFKKSQMSFTSSSIRNFKHHIGFIRENKVQTNEFGDSKWSSQNIFKLLNIEANDTEPLEGNLFFELFNQQRLFAFDRSILQNLPQWFQNQYAELSKGKKYSYSKFINQDHVTIMFPVVMGVPFLLNYESPTLIKLEGCMQTEIQPAIFKNGAFQWPKNIEISNKLQELIYVMNFNGKVGFLNGLDDRLYYAGITSKFQVNLPIKTKINLDLQNTRVEIEAEPSDSMKDVNFLNYSVKPYTSSEKKNAPIPISYSDDYKEVQTFHTPVEINSTYGAKETGMVFKVQGNVQAPDGHWMNQNQMFNTDISVKFDAQRSFNQKLVATLQWGDVFILKSVQDRFSLMSHPKSESPTASTNVKSDSASASDFHINKPSDIFYGSTQRPQEIINSTASGMIYAKSYFTDVRFKFEGQQKSEYIATLSWATSNVDAKSQAVFYFQKSGLTEPFQVCSIVKILKHNTPELDYKKAFEYKVQSKFQTELKFGESCETGAKLSLKGLLKQSPQRHQYLGNDPNVKACQKQMSNGFHQAPVCQYSIFQANLFDRMQAKIEYDVGVAAKNLSYNIYSTLRKLGHKYEQGDLVDSLSKPGEIELEAQLTEDLKILNVSIGSADRDVKFSGIPLSPWVAELIAIHPALSPVTRLFNYATARAYTPTCAIDSGFVTTFSNKTYSYEIGKCWHVAMINEPGQQMSQPQLSVTVRDIGKQQKEAQIYYSNEDGDKLFIYLQPSYIGSDLSVQVSINGKQVDFHEYKAYEEWKKNRNAPLIQAYGIPGGEVVINVDDSTLRVIYDGERIKLFGSESYRNATRGICGAMSGEDIDDYISPEKCIHREAKYAASLYALVGEECEGPALKWNRLAQNVPCVYRKRTYTVLFRSDTSNDKIEEDTSSPSSDEDYSYETIADTKIDGELVYESRSYYNFKGKCKVQKQAQAYESNGEICITLESVPACNPRCRMSKNKPQIVKSVCRSSKNQTFRMYRNQLKQGKNIELDENKYETTAKAYYKFALSCY